MAGSRVRESVNESVGLAGEFRSLGKCRKGNGSGPDVGSDAMQDSGGCLETIESAIARDSSPLALALRDLGDWAGGRGTCLLIEHEELGEALIADQRWSLGREETLRQRQHFAVVDLRGTAGFRRLAVLVEPNGTEARLDPEGCALTIAALRVTEALSDIAEQFGDDTVSAAVSGGARMGEAAALGAGPRLGPELGRPRT